MVPLRNLVLKYGTPKPSIYTYTHMYTYTGRIMMRVGLGVPMVL